MANTTKQRKRIEQDLCSRFIHPSPVLMKKWEKRRAEKGNGQNILTQEFNEWLNEGKELAELKARYKERLANELWMNEAFKRDIGKAHKIYKRSNSLESTKELQDKYSLNYGWLIWLAHCIETGENDPGKLLLYLVKTKGAKAKHISLDIYFPLPDALYTEAMIYSRMKEPEIFGDYYSQEQSGGRLKHSRPRETLRKYNKITTLRNSASWRMRTDKEFLEHYPEYNRPELARAKRWEKEGKPGL
jgi:hypothetical protein